MNGKKESIIREKLRFTLKRGDNGNLKLDYDSFLHTTRINFLILDPMLFHLFSEIGFLGSFWQNL